MMAEWLKYHHRGERKIPVQKDDDIEIYPSLTGVPEIAENSPKMTGLNDLREENENKIKNIKTIMIISMRKQLLLLLWDSSTSTF